jgi:hypothetical protein
MMRRAVVAVFAVGGMLWLAAAIVTGRPPYLVVAILSLGTAWAFSAR